jgi:SAM-dependent methyltransferase
MSTSIIYKSTLLYEAFLWLRYRGEYRERSEAIAALIPKGSSLVDVCCGPATLYFKHLRAKQVAYTGLDINRGFVERLSAHGVAASVWDATANTSLPSAEYLVMQGSLYHFLPDPYPIVDRMIRAAKKSVILTEPVRNLADSKNPLVAGLARKLSNPGTRDQPNRFNGSLFEKFVSHYRAKDLVIGDYTIAGGREQLCILRGAHLQERPTANG